MISAGNVRVLICLWFMILYWKYFSIEQQQEQDSFEKVKPEIILYLENQKKVDVLEKFIESLKKNAKIEYVNKDYNPTDIQSALKKQAKQNSDVAEQVDAANHSATPVAVPDKK